MIETLALAAMLHHSVAPGDTLWGIAQANGVSVTQLEQANPQISNPDLIRVGQVVNVPSFGGNAPSLPQGATVVAGDGDHDGDDGGVSTPVSSSESSGGASASVVPQTPQAQAPSSVSAGGSSFEQCVIQRESGGNPSAVNSSSGAGGLFQFLPSTWAGLGFSGLPQNASVATQQQAFNKAVAQFGHQPWTPSDGC